MALHSLKDLAAPANLRLTVDSGGICISADARKPAPEFAAALKRLANPPLVSERDSFEVGIAKRRCVAAFARHPLYCDVCGGLADTDGCVSECVGFAPFKRLGLGRIGA